MNRTTAIWFWVAGVLILSFGFLYQVVDPAYYEATSIVDLALVFLQAVVAVVVGIALILLWRDPPVSRGSLFLLFAGVGAIAIGVGGLPGYGRLPRVPLTPLRVAGSVLFGVGRRPVRMRRLSILTVIVTIMSVLAVPALGAPPDRPFVGSWESFDPAPDNSHVRLHIGGNGNWNLRDEAGSVCLDNGFGFVPATARGTGQFTSPDTFEAGAGDIYCYPRDGQGRQFVFRSLSTGYAYWEIPDVLIDQSGVCWWRSGTGDPSNCPPE